jgi:hypothetical protein
MKDDRAMGSSPEGDEGMIRNVHRRYYRADLPAAGALIDGLASEHDKLWPRDRWPAMHFDRPLGVGAAGGHGPIRYRVEEYQPGRYIRFRFTAPRGFIGTHAFHVREDKWGLVQWRHEIDMRLEGWAKVYWLLAIRWLHDALIEDAFDQAETHLVGIEEKRRSWSPWVALLRLLMGGRAKRGEDGLAVSAAQ